MNTPIEEPAREPVESVNAVATAVLPDPNGATLERLGEKLRAHIARAERPSLLLNRLQAALVRGLDSQHQLRRLFERAPRIAGLLKQILSEAFGHDPHRLVFTPPLRCGAGQTARSLAQVALSLLRNPFLSLAPGHGMRLSLADEPGQALSLDPEQVLVRLRTLGLSSRLDTALRRYWDQPASDSHVSRRERLIELHKLLFHDKALLTHGIDGLSIAGFNMLMGLLDAPTPEARALAGGRWGRLRVAELVWPGNGAATLALSGALHLHGSGSAEQGRQVLFVPGVSEELFEFSSHAEMQQQLAQLLNTPGSYRPWQLLALQERHQLFPRADRPALAYRFQTSVELTGDALAHSALSRLDTQLANEWAAALLLNTAYMLPEGMADAGRLTPLQAVEAMQDSRMALTGLPPLGASIAQLLRRDEQRRMLEISFGSLAVDLPVRLRQSKVRQQERALLKRLDEQDLGRDTPAYSELLARHKLWRQQAADVQGLLQKREGHAQSEFWSRRDKEGRDLPGKLLEGRGQGLLHEAQLQHQLGLIDQQELARVFDMLPQPLVEVRAASDTRVAAITLGPADSPWSLAGACAISTRQALADPRSGASVLLFVPGRLGGLQRFMSRDSLSQRLDISLRSPECESFWPLIARDRRNEARSWVRGLAAGERIPIHYRSIATDALQQGLQQQIQDHLRLCRLIEGGLRPFSEIADASSSLQLLAHELEENLGVPGHEARDRALDNVATLQLGAVQARGLPGWLSAAPRMDRQQYARLLTRYQRSVQALELKLEHQLPDLDDFARGKIIERLKQDGFYPGLDIDKPLFDLPDSVERVWVGHPERTAGEAGPKTLVSDSRQTYSFLRLALENLDPQAPWTKRRLQHGRILDSAWRQRLSPDYLIATISALDLGGHYDTRIQRAFYGVDNSRLEPLRAFDQALLYRLVRQRAHMELFGARQQGLSDWAAEVFAMALNAEFVADLHNEHVELELYFVTFAGRAFARARHVGNAVAIHDKLSGRTLVYLPGAPHEQVLTEHTDLAAAQRALVEVERASQRVADIVQRLAAGWEAEVIEGYPAEQGPAACSTGLLPLPEERVPLVLTSLGIEPVSTLNSVALVKAIKSWWSSESEQAVPDPVALEKEVRREVAENPGHWLRLKKTQRCDLSLILAHALVLRAQQRARSISNSARQLAQIRELREREQRSAYWLRVLSVIPVVSIAVNTYETAVALRRFHRSGDPRDAFELFKAAHMTLLDAVLTFSPARLAGRPARVAHALWPRAALKTIGRRQALSHKGATALKKVDVMAKPRPLLPGYEAKISADDALALHGPSNAGSYVKDGVQFITDGRNRYEVYRPKGESALRLKKTAAQDNELVLHIREPGEYLLRADAPEPMPGPSRGIWHRPWEQPVSPPAATGAPVPQLEWMTRRPALLSSDWKTWGLALEREQVVELSASRGLYRRHAGAEARLLKLGDHYFELLPDGSGIHPDIVFLKRPGSLATHARNDFNHWWRHLDEQPVPATFDQRSQTWTPRTPLFSVPAEQSLAQPMEGMMQSSLRRTLHRLIERSDVQGTSVTATRMVALRRTQESWVTRGVDMHVLFRELDARPLRWRNHFIGEPDGITDFSRLDFHPPHAIDQRIFDVSGLPRIADLALNTEQAVTPILRRHGFVVTEIPKARSFNTVNLFCSHPGTDQLFYITLKWTKRRSVALPRSRGAPQQLTDEWLRRIVEQRTMSQHRLLQPVRAALDQGRLVKMVAGLQRVPGSDQVVVFFVRVI
ncbi:dermonecrotic toxin domain-containing protein [Pseudomonas sp. MWU13-2105]|uniref:dermonecrotic toxin domain-containing protein n=1 Tax=Pseudomonas sp. MWU13-2105 TaxID=2935074 RepID=UPI00200F6226|nr:DUF6543 domain-containing protein [Pseudomonas sp. MWU13-2105]